MYVVLFQFFFVTYLEHIVEHDIIQSISEVDINGIMFDVTQRCHHGFLWVYIILFIKNVFYTSHNFWETFRSKFDFNNLNNPIVSNLFMALGLL